MTSSKKPDPSGRAPVVAPSSPAVAVPRRWLVAGLGAVVLPWLVVGAIYVNGGSAAPPIVAQQPPAVAPSRGAAQGPGAS